MLNLPNRAHEFCGDALTLHRFRAAHPFIHLPANAPEAATLVGRSRERGLFVRDMANMGTCFDARTLRIAVKDRETNRAMLQILRATLAEMTEARPSVAA